MRSGYSIYDLAHRKKNARVLLSVVTILSGKDIPSGFSLNPGIRYAPFTMRDALSLLTVWITLTHRKTNMTLSSGISKTISLHAFTATALRGIARTRASLEWSENYGKIT